MKNYRKVLLIIIVSMCTSFLFAQQHVKCTGVQNYQTGFNDASSIRDIIIYNNPDDFQFQIMYNNGNLTEYFYLSDSSPNGQFMQYSAVTLQSGDAVASGYWALVSKVGAEYMVFIKKDNTLVLKLTFRE